MKEAMEYLVKSTDEVDRLENMHKAKYANLIVALDNGDYAEIEKARMELMAVYEAVVDCTIKHHKKKQNQMATLLKKLREDK